MVHNPMGLSNPDANSEFRPGGNPSEMERVDQTLKLLPKWVCECDRLQQGWHCACGKEKPKRERWPLAPDAHEIMEEKYSSSKIDRPQHYARWKIEPVTFIQVNRLPFCEGNAVKYICRHDAKNGLEDVKKALRYVQMVAEDHYGVHILIDWDMETPVDGITTQGG